MTLPAIKIWRDSEVVYAPHWKDTSNVVLANSARAPYPTKIIEPLAVGIIHAIKYSTTYSDTDYATELNAVNSVAWRGWQPGQAWVSRIVTEEDMEINGTTGVTQVHYIVRLSEIGWQLSIADLSAVYVASGAFRPFLADGSPYLGKLDGSGAQRAVGSDMVMRSHNIKRTINFASVLGF